MLITGILVAVGLSSTKVSSLLSLLTRPVAAIIGPRRLLVGVSTGVPRATRASRTAWAPRTTTKATKSEPPTSSAAIAFIVSRAGRLDGAKKPSSDTHPDRKYCHTRTTAASDRG